MKESLVLLLTSEFLLVRTKSVYVSANCLTNYDSPSLKSSRAEKIKAKCILIYGGKTTNLSEHDRCLEYIQKANSVEASLVDV